MRIRRLHLAMRHRGKDVILKPLPIGKHLFLMTVRAEIPSLAGVGHLNGLSGVSRYFY